MSKIEVSFTPENYQVYENRDSIVVVTDVLRATSAICTALHNGATEIIPVSTIEEARQYMEQGFLVGAERNGEKIPEFNFGNSPFDYMSDEITNKPVVLTTTNGTRAINMAAESFQVIVGAFTNISAVVNYIADHSDKDVLVLCSGWKGRYNLEDTLFAGALTYELNQKGVLSEIEDSALSAMYLYNLAKDDPYKFLMNSSHRRRLKKLNLKEDVRYCLRTDFTDIVPILKEGKLVPSNGKSELPQIRFAKQGAA